MGKRRVAENPVVHLELRTPNLARACAFYTQLFAWRAETLHVASVSYMAIGLGQIDGGVVEDDARAPLWLPYVEVPECPRDDPARRGARCLDPSPTT